MVHNINVNVNLDLCFTISCERFGRLTILVFPLKLSATIAKFQALEIFYRAHARAVEGAVGELKSVSWGGARTNGEVHKRELSNKMFLHSDHHLSFLGRAYLPFFLNGFVAIYFQPIFDRQFRKVVLLVLQQCDRDCVVFSGRSTPLKISSCNIDLVDGAQYKCKFKP